jgi:RHS repeat-associated protein
MRALRCGRAAERGGTSLVYSAQSISGSAGRPKSSSTPSSSGGLINDPNGRATGSKCEILLPALGGPGVPAGFPALPCDAAALPEWYALFQATYNNMDQALSFDVTLTGEAAGGSGASFARDRVMVYDELGRTRSESLSTDESGGPVTRAFSYEYDWAAGSQTRTGPDGVETFVQFDVANRVEFFRRGPAGNPVMTAAYTYYDDDRVQSVTYGNGASTHYSYDDARRLTVIDHRDGTNATFLRLTYTYTNDDLPDSITESDGGGWLATVEFAYDARDRLIAESRDALDVNTEYNLEYLYDQGGNRTKKIDQQNAIEVQYHYDLEDPALYASANNRLMYFETLDVSGESSTLLATTWYYYNASGNPTRIVSKPEASVQYSATRLAYAKNGETVTYVVGETWEADGADPDNCPENYDITFAREFRYDSGRARYLNREFDAAGLSENPVVFTIFSETWTDYERDAPYGDFRIDGGATDQKSYHPGVATIDPWADQGGNATNYFHTNHLGTTRGLSTPSAALGSEAVYTAFGERIDGPNHRYGYIGTWGYQAHDEFAYVHVGFRYYDASSGRFLQRDPIGVLSNGSLYEYVGSTPTKHVDPSGLYPFRLPVPMRNRSPQNESQRSDRAPVPSHPTYNPRPGPSSEFYFDAWAGCATPLGGFRFGYKTTVPVEPSSWWGDIKDWARSTLQDFKDAIAPDEGTQFRRAYGTP